MSINENMSGQILSTRNENAGLTPVGDTVYLRENSTDYGLRQSALSAAAGISSTSTTATLQGGHGIGYAGPATSPLDSSKGLTGFLKPETTSLGTGMKFDGDKLPMDLLDPEALEGLARVLAFGRNKYAAHNWRGGLSYSRLIAALLRHTFAILRGEYIDEESGLPHIDHVGCCWMFLSNMMKTRPDMDDLYKKEQ